MNSWFKAIALLLAVAVFGVSCASTEIVQVQTTDGEVVNVRAEKDEPTALDTPITWADYLLFSLISIGLSLASAAIIVGQAQ